MPRKVKAKTPPVVPTPPPVVNVKPPGPVNNNNAQSGSSESPPFFVRYFDPPPEQLDRTPIRFSLTEKQLYSVLYITRFNNDLSKVVNDPSMTGFDKAAHTLRTVAEWTFNLSKVKRIFLQCFCEDIPFEELIEKIAEMLPSYDDDDQLTSEADSSIEMSTPDTPEPTSAPLAQVVPPCITNPAPLCKDGQEPPKTTSQSPHNPSPPKKTNNAKTTSNWASDPPPPPSVNQKDTHIETSIPDAPIHSSAPPSSVAPPHTPSPASSHKRDQSTHKADPQPPLNANLLSPKKVFNSKKANKSPSHPSTAENTFPVLITPKRPPPKSAPPVSTSASPRPNRHNEAKHTSHGPSRRGIYLTPPAQSSISAGSFTLETINNLNSLIIRDLHIEDFTITAAHQTNSGIHLDTTRPPMPPITAFVLKHVRRIFPTPDALINVTTPTSCSYLKVQDVPIVYDSTKVWVKPTSEVFINALKLSLVGSSLFDHIKHKPRIMRVSPHSDSCIAWIDIHNTTSGKTAASLIGKFIPINGINCCILGARPHSGTIFCTRCQKWGHHFSQCRSQATRCSLCRGFHHTSNHDLMVKPERRLHYQCINCSASKQNKTNHAATDHKCPFWQHHFDRDWHKCQFKPRTKPSIPSS